MTTRKRATSTAAAPPRDSLAPPASGPGSLAPPAAGSSGLPSYPCAAAAFVGGLPGPVRDVVAVRELLGILPDLAARGYAPATPPAAARAAFSDGALGDRLAPGPALGLLAFHAGTGGYQLLDDDQLTGVLRGAARQVAHYQATEAAVVSELGRRRKAQAASDPKLRHLAEHVTDEISAELTLTGQSAGRLRELAAGLVRLPVVYSLLSEGQIDWARAGVFADELSLLGGDDAARQIAGRYADRAPGWTTGKLRAALARAVLAADPTAADRRKKQAAKDTRVDLWHEDSGNAALAGRELPAAKALQLDARLDDYAWFLGANGVPGSKNELRALAFTTLLNGGNLEDILDNPQTWPVPPDDTADGVPLPDAPPPGDGDDSGDPAGSDGDGTADSDTAAGAQAPAGSPGTPASSAGGAAGCGEAAPASSGSSAGSSDGAAPAGRVPLPPARAPGIHLVMPLSAFDGGSAPGEVTGLGLTDAADSRAIARLLAGDPDTRWHLTLTAPDGTPAGHACAKTGPAPGQSALEWAAGLAGKLQFLQYGDCDHHRQSAAYQPPPRLRHLIQVRQRQCGFPGCRRAAHRCDLDHTIPYAEGGRTDECNLAPLCRKHHGAKQAPRWNLSQDQPGLLRWTLPSGRSYQTAGETYPAR